MSDKTLRTHTDTVGAEGLDDWRWMLRALHARFRTGDFVTGLRLATAIAEAAEEMDHHPDLDLRYPHLNVRLSSHDVGGVTDRDLRLARRISELAAGVGVAADPSAVQVLELALDTADLEGVRPFWLAVLGMSETASPDELVDKGGSLPTLWFQETDPHDEPRQRFHVDITVPPEVAPGRIEAALAAGGTLVSAAREPAFTILADAEGNKACVCTSAGRD
ncbi:4a-hydroxytetrahydrobiopterin dehydratase [Nocardioides ginsengisegetis]|uniref:Putative pterin-4-alpha-carbinolamine dehydratase n=1 Tax=Nocardioides ginsengisegetis TaxID=661491 RepID=A0A7W3PA51_9ACTN|nr:4a-hydroxytetrahydrobiopterin dehydratase [Nocardioides ginsengisegetis]